MDRGHARRLAESLDEERLVWIMGSSRSGSTWLLRMLSELPGAVAIDDPHIGHHLGVWRPIPLAWATAAERPELATLDRVKEEKPGYFFNDAHAEVWRPLLRDLIAGRFAAQAATEAPGAVRAPLVVVKEPGAQAAEHLLSLFPRSRLVFLLRDGRDVVDSWLAAYQDGSWAQDEGAFPLAERGREAFVRWQSAVWAYRTEAMGRAYAAHDPRRRVLVRYESLLADPPSELRRICRAASVRVPAEDLERIAATYDFDGLPEERKGEARETRAATPGAWRENLTIAEQRVVDEELGHVLRRFGYAEDRELARAA